MPIWLSPKVGDCPMKTHYRQCNAPRFKKATADLPVIVIERAEHLT